jgi:predicted ATPase/DNA-binding winged helix-turn-helix (wHTH) protein
VSERVLKFGSFEIFPSRGLLLDAGTPVRLGSRAFLILLTLAEHRGELVTKDALTAAAWPDTHVDDVNLRVHLTGLRRALGDNRDGLRFILNVPGRGYRFVAPVTETVIDTAAAAGTDGPTANPPETGSDTPDQVAAASLGDSFRQSVPNPLTRLIGRDRVVGLVGAQLGAGRLVTIVGPGGIGKTSVALAVAHSRAVSDDDVCFIDLSSVADPNLVPVTVAAALSAPTPSEDPVGGIIQALRQRALIILLDKCEHVIDAVAAIVETILKGTSNIRLLATSREPLHVAGERIHRLASLAVPPAGADLTAAAALGYPGVELFVERASALVEDFTLSDDDAPIVADICRRLDGIPLAVELAAARVDLFSLRSLAQGLGDRFALLTRGRRTALPRHQTLRATLDWSYNLLAAPEQALLRRLSVFPGSFALDDLAAIAPQPDPSAMPEAITSLVVKSMLVAEIGGEEVRYRLLETTRDYALQKLRDAGEAEEAFLRHANHIQTLLRRDPATTTQSAWLARSSRAMDDLRAALDRAFLPGGDASTGIALTMAALPLWYRLALLVEDQKYIDLALAAVSGTTEPHAGDEAQLQAALALGRYYSAGPVPIVFERLQRALTTARSADFPATEQAPLLPIIWMLAFISGNAGNYRANLAYAEAYAQAMPGSPDTLAPARYDRMTARSLHDLGHHGAAQPLIERALTAVRTNRIRARLNAYDNDHWIAARATRARILWLQGFADDALAELDGCATDAHALQHAQSTCWALIFHLCPVAIWCGRLDLARDLVMILLVQSRRNFEHWHGWGRLYAGILDWLEHGSGPKLPASAASCTSQGDLLGTLMPGLATAETQARVEADPENWSAPEILRARAEQLLDTGEPGAEAERLLLAAQDLAARQGALAWALRTAMSLARLRRMQGRTAEALAILAPVHARFTQGFATRDLEDAARLLHELAAGEAAGQRAPA